MNYPLYADDISGLPRQCPNCSLIAHYEIKSRKPTMVKCPECNYEFTVTKYKRNERPK